MVVEDCWNRACEQVSVPTEVSKSWYQLIIHRYRDYNSRHYHNDKLLTFKINLLEPNVASHLVFAIFFQYYEFDVRDFGYAENCDAFNKFYIDTGINDQKLLESVLQLLGDPQFNNAEIENDLLYFQDLDLAVFGASRDEYKSFATQLQKEYVHMDEHTYKNMRLKILQTFLTIPHIFSTELLRNRFEDIARTNISNEIMELKK